MYAPWSKKLERGYNRFLDPSGRFLHKRLRLSPNQISILSLLLSLSAAFFIYQHQLSLAFSLLFLSLFLDTLDGNVARQYGLATSLGAKLEIIFDSAAEIVLFVVLYLAGFVSFYLIITAWFAIMVMRALAVFSQFDLGFKRIMIFFGPLIGFYNVFYIIIVAQLIAIFISLGKLISRYVLPK